MTQHSLQRADHPPIRYWTYGDKAKPTLIMIHGFRGTHHGLQKIISLLHDFYIIVPDLPGFGASPRLNTEHTLPAYIDAINDVIKTVSPKKPIYLLGHSFGSIVASHYTATYGQHVKKLILINPIGTLALKGPRRILTKLTLFYYKIGSILPEKLSRKWLGARWIITLMGTTMRRTKNIDIQRYINEQHYAHFSSYADKNMLREAFVTSVSHTVTQAAPDITTETLVVAGAEDDITSLEDARDMMHSFTQAKHHLVAIPNVGHLIHYETPDDAAKAIIEFLT